ncbi:Fic family protein [Microcoleus sp. N9_A1]|uniref:Fic family protein n=1 Tax=Microcoleus sp. N9_A1 TaxID=3055380 RepID=UPI002FD26A22
MKQIHNLIIRAILFVGVVPVGAGFANAPDEAGRYRQLDVKAAGTEYLYPPHYLLSDLMPEFIQWLNSDQIKSLHPLEFAAEAHLRFVSIHPFRDGNGRTGRLLMNLLLLRGGYPIVTVSNEVRAAYNASSFAAAVSKAGLGFISNPLVSQLFISLLSDSAPSAPSVVKSFQNNRKSYQMSP